MASPSGPLQLAWNFHQSGQLELAARLYRRLLSVDPDNADAHHLLGMIALGNGRTDEAVGHLARAVECDPTQAQFYDHLGDAHMAAGDYPAAIDDYQKSLEIEPNSAVTWNELGTALRENKQPEEAEGKFRRALAIDANLPEAHNNLGNALQDQERLAEASECFVTAARLRPESAEIQFNMGNCYKLQKKLDLAREAYRRAVTLNPQFAKAHYHLGLIWQAQRNYEQGLACQREALRLQGDYFDAIIALGAGLHMQKKFDEARATFQRALDLRPGDPTASFNMAAVMHAEGHYDEAIAGYEAVLKVKDDHAETLGGLAGICAIRADYSRAMEFIERALAAEPQSADLLFQRGCLRLARGDWLEGWKDYDYRLRGRYGLPRDCQQPRWEGESLQGKTILLYTEYGMGDALQFIRYCPLVRQRGGRVICEVRPQLMPLLTASGIPDLVAAGQSLPHFDFHAPLMSLPIVFQTDINSIPADVPYLFAEPARVETWRTRLASIDGFKIGISWQGNPEFFGDRHRSIPLSAFGALAAVEGVRLISLQKGFGSEQIERVPFRVETLSGLDEQGAFLDTAAVMQNLDLLVTSDSAAAHLAGAMGLEVWLALSTASEWRWLLDRTDNPWYPTMRLYRQSRLDDWSEVLARIADDVKSRIRSRAGQA